MVEKANEWKLLNRMTWWHGITQRLPTALSDNMALPWLAVCISALLALSFPRPGTPDAKELAAQATRLRIPMPPKDAPLVLAHVGYPDDAGPVLYTPAFLLEQKADGSAVVLRGFERETV